MPPLFGSLYFSLNKSLITKICELKKLSSVIIYVFHFLKATMLPKGKTELSERSDSEKRKN